MSAVGGRARVTIYTDGAARGNLPADEGFNPADA